MRFRVNSPQVISETIQGETIVIHLMTGTYYSLQNTAADAWEGIAASATAGEIAATLANRYDASVEEIEDGVAALVGQLRAEDLIVEMEDADATASSYPARDAANGTARLPFQAPRLEKFTDMQDLVLLDPVHEVDPRGWPHAKAEA
jgi:hypothetical protein